MLKLLRVEWLKLKNYRAFWILLGMTVVCIPGASYSLYNLMDNSFPKTKGAKIMLGSPFAFPDVWQTVSWNSTWLFIIPAILIITLVTNEFTYKTHRQNVIDGWSRGQFIGVKLVVVLLLSIVSTITVLLTALCFGYFGNKLPDGVSIWPDSRFVLYYFVQALSYCMIAFLLGLLIRRAGLAIGAFLLYMLLENIVVGIGRNVYKLDAMNYFPKEVASQLIPQPYFKGVIQLQNAEIWRQHLPVYLTVAAVYLVIYCVFAQWRFTKSDL